jgi:hypothetical protein
MPPWNATMRANHWDQHQNGEKPAGLGIDLILMRHYKLAGARENIFSGRLNRPVVSIG